ncbi:hypothetical protein D5R81_16640 [Parashewanella spongiae]|uniref:Uncharacterized protein n=1 Tax=Parashewanella spongiae TaxID=342950 RepID=A0A3A6TIW8_9GAMM|nr:hypothetical protein [Parashewanella spongiae]MCL1080092.1 hypothetical protein [Parashewanella spongiae]RJY07073.1 hypothetical protein D5R81_16640 [Parashewanella spongiae]
MSAFIQPAIPNIQPQLGSSYSSVAIDSPTELITIEKHGEQLVYRLNVSPQTTNPTPNEQYFKEKDKPSCLTWDRCCWSTILSAFPGGFAGMLTGALTGTLTSGAGNCVAGLVGGGFAGACIGACGGPALVSVSFGSLVVIYKISTYNGKGQALRLSPSRTTANHLLDDAFKNIPTRKHIMKGQDGSVVIEHWLEELPADIPSELVCPSGLFTLKNPVFLNNFHILYSKEYIELLSLLNTPIETGNLPVSLSDILKNEQLTEQQRIELQEVRDQVKSFTSPSRTFSHML